MTAPEGANPPAAAHEVVLDTNVWLDLLVFDEPAVAPLFAALTLGRLAAYIDAYGLAEFERVLGYRLGRWSLDDGARAGALAACRDLAREYPGRRLHGAPRSAMLPACRDCADQPFLELARNCGARCLITRDRDLLMLARKRNPALPFAILTPCAAIAELELPA